MNLMNNAKDALADSANPEIRCVLARFKADEHFHQTNPDIHGDDFARLSLIDNGNGIPENKLLHIFEPFFTTKEVGKGTGLGLSMTYGAVQSHGGVIEVESQIGKGTSFHIYLPLVDQEAPLYS